MANRAMQAKLERAIEQKRELARVEYSKPFYNEPETQTSGRDWLGNKNYTHWRVRRFGRVTTQA